MYCIMIELISNSQDYHSVPCAAASPGGEEGDRHELLVKDVAVVETLHNVIHERSKVNINQFETNTK